MKYDFTPPTTDMERCGTSEYPPMGWLEFVIIGKYENNPAYRCVDHAGSYERYPNEE